jgi:hypothetical protein
VSTGLGGIGAKTAKETKKRLKLSGKALLALPWLTVSALYGQFPKLFGWNRNTGRRVLRFKAVFSGKGKISIF